MTDRERIERFLRSKIRAAGRTVAEAEQNFKQGRERGDIPTDEYGRSKIVCRGHAERRAVHLDGENRPECYDEGHPDCEGCVEDIYDGRIETWD
jgi:hypothetical protein